jgi:hypothetical protein
MAVTVNGQTLARDLVWNVRTIGERISTAGRRGSNVEANVIDGTLWRPGKPLAELLLTLSMWIAGSDPDGEFPTDPFLRTRMRRRLDQLLLLMGQQDGLAEIADTETGRRCFAEIVDTITPSTMAAGARAEVAFPLVVPAGCWEDVDEFDTGTVAFDGSTDVTVPCGGSTLPTVGLRLELTPPATNVLIETAAGRTVRFNGALPAGAVTVLDLNPRDPQVYQASAPGVSLLGAVELPDVVCLPLPAAVADPVLTATATGTSGASRIRVRGRRRWQTA